MTDAGDMIAVRCSFTYVPKVDLKEAPDQPNVVALKPPPPKHRHKATLVFAREGQPYDLLWDGE